MGVIRRAAVALVACGGFATAVPAAASAVTVTGGDSPSIGTTLTATPDNDGDQIDWVTCDDSGTQVAGTSNLATNQTTYTLALSDAGTRVCAVEQLLLGTSTSSPVGPVSNALAAGAGPAISVGAGQSVAQGQTLTATRDGAWGPGATVADTWQACNADGSGCQPVGSGPTYTATRADANRAIVLTQTATASNGNSSAASTAATAPVTGAVPTNAGMPTIAGTATIGGTLTASPGAWTNDPTGYAYQWARCAKGNCAGIPGASGPTYVPVAADAGHTLEVLVSAAVYSSASAAYPSFPTATVPAPSTARKKPTKKKPTKKKRRATKTKHRKTTSSPLGRIASTAQWTFHYAPDYTQVLALDVHGPPLGSTVTVRCTGRGCPYAKRSQPIVRPKHCGSSPTAATSTSKRKPKLCPVPGVLHLQPGFGHRQLRAGATLTITITRRRYVGKYYRFVIRAARQPTVQIRCLAPGADRPGRGCTAA